MTVLTPATGSQVADMAVELAGLAGLELSEGQAGSLREGLRMGQDGKFEHFEYRCWDRTVLEVRALAGLLLFADQRVVWSGPRVDDAFRRLARMLAECPQFSGQVKTVRRANGAQRIELVNNSVLWFVSRSAGRGLSADLVIAAGWTGSPQARAEIVPTVLASANPQIWYGD